MPDARPLVPRHRLSTRLWHWLNALTVIIMVMSGLMIFNAHPRLYWGKAGANSDPAWLEIGSTGNRGLVRIGSVEIPTTGVLGLWRDANGVERRRAFPHWATIPSGYSLSSARLWHLFFAWVLIVPGIAYLLWSVINRHLRRDLLPSRAELRPSAIWHDVRQHARLRFPKGQAALRYNILQKLAYCAVLLLILPLLVLTGLAMSPAMDAGWPWLLDLFGGRQSARSLHFIAMASLVGFILVHLIMVVLAGPWNEIRSMITGRFRLPPEEEDQATHPEGEVRREHLP
ncbi:cytochrome b/b6 domain-containing protein [Sphingomonas jatrophae]|uniref:Thiosulfate reductase cytochrome b subunit n=1 Tax=Sphingomonas jatrophae TaxID=1166337 RepID=A0A1I6LMY2_9SPHN|nr:cytochrome b/b6 domain-containing protein [Sphingomonas jatrophae]SFS04602.1 Thiosulfate reductase cytochrome b subunit [Sphingomonas jatrophae]